MLPHSFETCAPQVHTLSLQLHWNTAPSLPRLWGGQCHLCPESFRSAASRLEKDGGGGEHPHAPEHSRASEKSLSASALGPEGDKPPIACAHVTCFCSNGLRIIPGIDGHRCTDCGETVDTDVPPCECCCHTERCTCCFFCKSIPCHCPQMPSLAVSTQGIHSLSPEAFGLIMTNELAQVSRELQGGREKTPFLRCS